MRRPSVVPVLQPRLRNRWRRGCGALGLQGSDDFRPSTLNGVPHVGPVYGAVDGFLGSRIGQEGPKAPAEAVGLDVRTQKRTGGLKRGQDALSGIGAVDGAGDRCGKFGQGQLGQRPGKVPNVPVARIVGLARRLSGRASTLSDAMSSTVAAGTKAGCNPSPTTEPKRWIRAVGRRPADAGRLSISILMRSTDFWSLRASSRTRDFTHQRSMENACSWAMPRPLTSASILRSAKAFCRSPARFRRSAARSTLPPRKSKSSLKRAHPWHRCRQVPPMKVRCETTAPRSLSARRMWWCINSLMSSASGSGRSSGGALNGGHGLFMEGMAWGSGR